MKTIYLRNSFSIANIILFRQTTNYFFLTLGYLYIEYKRLYNLIDSKPMGDYLKLFETHSEYEAYSGGGDVETQRVLLQTGE